MTQDQRVTERARTEGCLSAGDATGDPAARRRGPSRGRTAPIPVVLLNTVEPLRFMPYLAETRADSACFAKPSPVTLTADIAAGGAARQDDTEPKTESSACRPPGAAIPTSRPICPLCGDVIEHELPNTSACDPCYRAAMSKVTKADILKADAAYWQAIADGQKARKGQ